MDEQAIHAAQELNLIYSQSLLLYSILPNVSRPRMNPGKPTPSAHVNGMIGSAMNQVTNALSQVSLQSNAHANQAAPTLEVLNIQKTSNKGGQKAKKKRNKRTLTPLATVATITRRRMRGTIRKKGR